ncbi:hypothetical protein IWX47DRAFT_111624 [Phyllosticta citricarpa]
MDVWGPAELTRSIAQWPFIGIAMCGKICAANYVGHGVHAAAAARRRTGAPTRELRRLDERSSGCHATSAPGRADLTTSRWRSEKKKKKKKKKKASCLPKAKVARQQGCVGLRPPRGRVFRASVTQTQWVVVGTLARQHGTNADGQLTDQHPRDHGMSCFPLFEWHEGFRRHGGGSDGDWSGGRGLMRKRE